MPKTISGIDELKSMIQTLKKRDQYLQDVNNTVYDADQDSTPKEDRLHTSSPSMTAEESALYAQEYPEIEAHFQKLRYDVDQMLSKVWKKTG